MCWAVSIPGGMTWWSAAVFGSTALMRTECGFRLNDEGGAARSLAEGTTSAPDVG